MHQLFMGRYMSFFNPHVAGTELVSSHSDDLLLSKFQWQEGLGPALFTNRPNGVMALMSG